MEIHLIFWQPYIFLFTLSTLHSTLLHMNYLWQEFNIKTFPSETLVFKDGVFMPDLSTLKSPVIDRKYDLPIHIIYVGEIAGENNLNIEIKPTDQQVYLTAKIKNKKPAFLNIFIKNAGKNSFFNGRVLAQNYNTLKIDVFGHNFESNTGIIIKTKLVAHAGSDSDLFCTAKIDKFCKDCESDISFAALAAPDAKIQFKPKQLISAAPTMAEHSAAIESFNNNQIEYLRTAGLSGAEIKQILEEAFLNE